LAPALLGRILDRIRADREIAAGAEITLEANPDDVTPETACEWHRAGVNRISLGVQSFEPAVLRWMHRTHDAAQVPAAVGQLRRVGFENLSLDLIFGLPAELSRDWARDLESAVALEPEHLSLYGLTVEPHTPLGRWVARGESPPVSDEPYATEFLAANARLRALGFEHYEVSNYARPGRQAIHNQAYWEGRAYLGLGPAAHSAWQSVRQWNLREWSEYQRAIQAGRPVVAGREELDPEARHLERLYLGLRTSAGVPSEVLPEALRSIWEREGWMVHDPTGARARLTPEGWLRMDALVAAAAHQSPVLQGSH
jgi:oxygen-independent coproporphyrinogen-3 oxidase